MSRLRWRGSAPVVHHLEEGSFRGRNEADSFELAEPDPPRIRRYLASGESLVVQRYGRYAPVRQKIEALAGRTRIEARDIFDLHLLLQEDEPAASGPFRATPTSPPSWSFPMLGTYEFHQLQEGLYGWRLHGFGPP